MLAISLADFCHKEIREWNAGLDLYMTELAAFQKRLEEVVKKNTGDLAMKQVEHFQNQFVIHKDNIQTLQHECKIQEQDIAEDQRRDAILEEKDIIGNQSFLRDKVHMQEKLWISLRHDYYRFLATIM